MSRFSLTAACVAFLGTACGGTGSSTDAPVVGSVSVSPGTATVTVGGTTTLSAQVLDQLGNPMSGQPVTWTTSNTSIATVAGAGVVTGVAVGNATITAAAGGKSGTATVAVSPVGLTLSSISTSWAHSCGVTPAGDGYCWGNNQYGQLGNNTTTNSATPVLVLGGLKFTSVSAGAWHTCGITTQSVVQCWGLAEGGRLGLGSTTTETCSGFRCSRTPRQAMPTIAKAVGAGNAFTCALATNGDAYCWGDNSFGQLGSGGTVNSSSPVEVAGFRQYTSIDVGFYEACALSAGIAYCWGLNDFGQLGTASTQACQDGLPCSRAPRPISFGLGFASISVGERYACAIATNSQAHCWGRNDGGQLGTGNRNDVAAPTPVLGGLSFTSIAAGYGLDYSHTCGVTTSGDGYCWGRNNAGQLGTGSTADSNVPVIVSGGIKFTALTAGGPRIVDANANPHTCGISTNGGTAYCWGDNSAGQLGTGTASGSLVPVAVRAP